MNSPEAATSSVVQAAALRHGDLNANRPNVRLVIGGKDGEPQRGAGLAFELGIQINALELNFHSKFSVVDLSDATKAHPAGRVNAAGGAVASSMRSMRHVRSRALAGSRSNLHGQRHHAPTVLLGELSKARHQSGVASHRFPVSTRERCSENQFYNQPIDHIPCVEPVLHPACLRTGANRRGLQ